MYYKLFINMNQKNNKPRRTFIPQSVGDSLKKISRNFSSKFGKIEFIIHSKWPDIVGSYFQEYSEPKHISKLPEYENELGETIYKNYLNVSLAPPAAIEFQHYKDKIIDKINSYFGYKAIIDLRIKQDYIPKINNISNVIMKNNKLSLNEKKAISNEVKEVVNSNLKESIINLGINITKESK